MYTNEVKEILMKVLVGDLDWYNIQSKPKTPAEIEASCVLDEYYESAWEDMTIGNQGDFEEITQVAGERLAYDFEAEYGEIQ